MKESKNVVPTPSHKPAAKQVQKPTEKTPVTVKYDAYLTKEQRGGSVTVKHKPNPATVFFAEAKVDKTSGSKTQAGVRLGGKIKF